MLRRVLRRSLTFSLFAPADVVSSDTLSKATETEKNVDLSSLQNETGWERLQRMFETDEWGSLSKEILTIMHVGGMSLFVGAVYGGFMHSRVAYMNFIKNNQATAFNDHLEAKKRLQDAVTKSFAKGAWKWSWRLSLFCSSFVGISTTISVYRGKTGILEYVTAGLVTGSLYKFSMGPRGWIVGGGLGAVLGLVAGSLTLGLLNLTGISMDEVRYWQYRWRQSRDDYVRKGMADYLAKEEGEVVFDHYKKMGKGGRTLENLDKENQKET